MTPPHGPRPRTLSTTVLLGAGLAAALGFGCGGPDGAPPPSRPPDVILVVLDTTRADRCSLYGYGRPTTPELERLAATAVTFEQAWTPARWTVPAHGTLFTGLLPRAHGARPSQGTTLYSDVPTLAERLAANGYATAAFCSNPAFELDAGLYRGFATVERLYGLQRRLDDRGPLAPSVHAAARAWVADARRRDAPFFLFVNDVDPHSPYQPPPDVARRFLSPGTTPDQVLEAHGYDGDRAIRHNFGGDPLPAAAIRVISDLYDAEIATLDGHLGTFLDALAADGALDHALVVITSDHGEYFGAHGLLDHLQGVHQDVLRIPLVVRWPDGRDAGLRVTDVVRLEDVPATVLDVCGVAVADPLDGISLRGDTAGRIARGESAPNPYIEAAALRVAPAEVARARLRSSRAVLEGTWRLIEHQGGAVELYDHAADPAETRDVARDHPEIVARLRDLVDRGP